MKTGPTEVVATELNINGRTASITYRTPGLYSLSLPIGDLEVRIIGQGAQGGGGALEFHLEEWMVRVEGRLFPDKPEKRANILIVDGEDLARLSTGLMTNPSYLTSMFLKEEREAAV